MSIRFLFAGALVALGLAATPASAREDIRASAERNPPPSEALSGFDRYEIAPIFLQKPYDGHKANQAALLNIQREFDQRIAPVLAEREAAATASSPGRVLRIEPRIEKIRFIGGGARFWAGAWAGKSAVLMRLRIVDAATGSVIAEPEFYQHAAAFAGAWSVGGADKAMLARIASLAVEYLVANRSEAVGGPTGSVPEPKGKTRG